MAALRADIELQRNGDYRREYAIVDDDGAPLDLTGAVHAFDVKVRAGDPDPVLASATVTTVGPAVDGVVEVHLSGDQFAAVGGAQEIVRLAYDWKVTQDGDDNIIMRGYIVLTPGVS